MSPKIDLPMYIVKPKNGGEAGVHLLSVGRLVPHKGHAVLLDAVSDLSDNIEDSSDKIEIIRITRNI